MTDTYGPFANPLMPLWEVDEMDLSYEKICTEARSRLTYSYRPSDYQFSCFNEKCIPVKWRATTPQSNCFSCGRFGKLQYRTN